MSWVAKVHEAIEYIEAHLHEEVSAETVGRAINYAPSSFAGIFGAITGYSVGEYIRFRRLSCAADRLAEGRGSVTDAAFDCGYETVEAFSKAFRRTFGCAPSRLQDSPKGRLRFRPISVDIHVAGGFAMRRNLIPGLLKVDWSDTQRQNEFINSVVSAADGLGERLSYDDVCAVSGSAFRTSFSMPSSQLWNHGNYHVIHTPPIIEHTFRMLGFRMAHHVRSDYDTDRALIMASIDRGSPVITLEGVINCADACVISGYDNDGAVLLGYSPFMHIEDDHKEAPDDTGYFRKSDWHEGFFAGGNLGRILIVDGRTEKPGKDAVLSQTLELVARLIGEESMAPGQYNGLAAHRAFANALMTYDWDDNLEPYLNVMCNFKQYLDRQYAVPFLREHGRDDLADIYQRIADTAAEMGRLIPQDFSAGDMFSDRERLRPYAEALMRVADLEEMVLDRLG